MRAARPNWNGLPDCQTGQATVTSPNTGLVVVGAAAVATAGIVGAAVFRRRQRQGGVV